MNDYYHVVGQEYFHGHIKTLYVLKSIMCLLVLKGFVCVSYSVPDLILTVRVSWM
jgi:hypothetical protein